MRGGALPPALLCAALGLALAFAPRKAVPGSLLALVAVAAAVVFLAPRIGSLVAWQEPVFIGCWTSIVLAAAAVHLPRGVGPRLALALAVNSGLWAGAVIAVGGARLDLLKALPWSLLALPGGWVVARRRGVVLKVMASWLIAVAVLAAALPATTRTPGYKPDHMD